MMLLLAKSKAGHDKGQIFVVTGSGDGYYSICDGKHRLCSKPKQKKEKHLQLIKHIPKEVTAIAESLEKMEDSDIRKIIRAYVNTQEGEADG